LGPIRELALPLGKGFGILGDSPFIFLFPPGIGFFRPTGLFSQLIFPGQGHFPWSFGWVGSGVWNLGVSPISFLRNFSIRGLFRKDFTNCWGQGGANIWAILPRVGQKNFLPRENPWGGPRIHLFLGGPIPH